MWLPGKSRNGGHDLCCMSTPGEVSGAKQRAVHHIRRLNQSFSHGQQGWSVEDNEEVSQMDLVAAGHRHCDEIMDIKQVLYAPDCCRHMTADLQTGWT